MTPNRLTSHTITSFIRQHRIRASVVIFGILLIVAMGLLEFMSSTAPGLGPYQLYMIVLGVIISSCGIWSVDSLGFRVSMILFSILVTVAGLEALTPRIEKWIPEPEQINIFESDRLLGKRVRPSAPGHDARGWRNAVALDTASIVTIGDSQTWGSNADVTQTWPALLSEITGQSVYNMSLGGYGPVQYVQLAHEALELHPNTLIVGFYFGNDLADAYEIVYGKAAYSDRRLLDPNTELPDYNITEAANNAYRNYRQIENRYTRAFVPSTFWRKMRYGTNLGRFLDKRGAIPAWLGNEGSLNEVAPHIQTYLQTLDTFEPVFANTVHATILTPDYRWFALRLDDPRIAEGLRLTTESLQTIQTLADEQGMQLLIVLIPTKEAVYADAMLALHGTLSTDYTRLLDAESAVHEQLTTFMDEAGIAWMDTLPALQASIEANVIAYPPYINGHPTPDGYRVIAQAVADRMEATSTAP